MDELGYTVNRQAQSLARGQTYSIGVLVPDLGTGYVGEIVARHRCRTRRLPDTI